MCHILIKVFFSFIDWTNSPIGERFLLGDTTTTLLKIGTIRCKEAYKLYFKKDELKEFIGYDFCFDDDSPIRFPRVNKADRINILTEIDLELPNWERLENVLKRYKDAAGYTFFEGFLNDVGLQFFLNTYMVTILIELDPL